MQRGFVNGNRIRLKAVTTAQFALAWPLLISNTYHCTAGDSHCSTHCSTVLHPFLTRNSYLLCPLFTTLKPIAHPLLLQRYRCSSQRFWKQYLPIGVLTYCTAQDTHPPFVTTWAICCSRLKTQQHQEQQDSMGVNDNFRLEEELFGSEGRRESMREWSCDMS